MTETTELQQTQKPERQERVGHGHFMPSDPGDSPSSTAYSVHTCNYSSNSFFSNILILKMAMWIQINDIYKELNVVSGHNKCPTC